MMILVEKHEYIFLRKSKAFYIFKKFKTLVKKESNCYINILRTDNEITFNNFNRFYKNHGIKEAIDYNTYSTIEWYCLKEE